MMWCYRGTPAWGMGHLVAGGPAGVRDGDVVVQGPSSMRNGDAVTETFRHQVLAS